MALSEKANRIKGRMMSVVMEQREHTAVEEECRDWLSWYENHCDGEAESITAELLRSRLEVRRRLAEAQLHNIALLGRVTLTPFQRRIMRLRYVQGRTWSCIVEEVGKSKQYVLKEHNRALETLAKTVGS